MTIEEILAGESKNVEFKENLPEKSIKYMKSVVAFANGTGGKIIFGIADKTREVVGFDKEDVFKKMDAIANAVSDSCEPAIIPDITLQTVDGKTVIVVEVSEGRQRPYYLSPAAARYAARLTRSPHQRTYPHTLPCSTLRMNMQRLMPIISGGCQA